jgi:hypothetical protein
MAGTTSKPMEAPEYYGRFIYPRRSESTASNYRERSSWD